MEGESMARGNHSFTEGDIRRRFGAIVGHTVAEVDTAGVLTASSASRNKGRIGAVIEQSVLGYPADSDRRPDIVIDGRPWEVKATGLVEGVRGGWRAKEPMSITAVAPEGIVAESFTASAFWHKAERLLVVYYLYVRPGKGVAVEYAGFEFKGYDLHTWCEVDRCRLEADWTVVREFVRTALEGDIDSEMPNLSTLVNPQLLYLDTSPKWPNRPRFRAKRWRPRDDNRCVHKAKPESGGQCTDGRDPLMENIFTDHVFPRYNGLQVMKPQMGGLNDPTLGEFSPLNLSALLKEDFKSEMFEEEFIYSFLNAARELAIAGRKAIDRPGMYVMPEYSYAIPVLFLTRHCMELAIKWAIRKCGGKPKREHSLKKLWNSLLSKLPEQKRREDSRAIKSMSSFVLAVADIDDNGISLRYSKDNAGNLTQDRSLFVNDEAVATYLENFVKQLELIDFGIITANEK